MNVCVNTEWNIFHGTFNAFEFYISTNDQDCPQMETFSHDFLWNVQMNVECVMDIFLYENAAYTQRRSLWLVEAICWKEESICEEFIRMNISVDKPQRRTSFAISLISWNIFQLLMEKYSVLLNHLSRYSRFAEAVECTKSPFMRFSHKHCFDSFISMKHSKNM